MKRPNTLGLRHVALNVTQLEACVDFYHHIIGMEIEWQPDPDNVYLTSGSDNLAIHRAKKDKAGPQSLDHIGFVLPSPESVDEWHAYLKSQSITLDMEPKTHRDGARSFYFKDPDANTLQMIYHPPISHMT